MKTVARAFTVLLAAICTVILAAGPLSAQSLDLGDQECPGCHTYPPQWWESDYEKAARRADGDSMPFLLSRGSDPAGAAPQQLPADADADPSAAPSCVPVPPQPAVAAWDRAPLPQDGQIHASPHPRGLTGMESRFWWSGTDVIVWQQAGASGVAADCSVIPADVERFTARAVRIDWDLGDGTVSSYRPGTEDDPAVRHVYETKSPDYVVRASIVWVGSPAGEVSVPAGELPYPVIEARAILTDVG